MDENENKVENVESNETVDSTVNTNEVATENSEAKEGEKKSFVEVLKSKKKLIIGVIIAIIAILIVMDILIRSPKEAVKKYISLTKSAHTKRAAKLYDDAGSHVFYSLDDDEYEDFWDEYKEYVKSDEWEDRKEELKETRDKEYYEDQDDEIKDSDIKVKIKKVWGTKKLGKNLYSVKAKVETKDDDDKETNTVKYYVMKKGLKSYVVGVGK